jgi:hypothetical protein
MKTLVNSGVYEDRCEIKRGRDSPMQSSEDKE